MGIEDTLKQIKSHKQLGTLKRGTGILLVHGGDGPHSSIYGVFCGLEGTGKKLWLKLSCYIELPWAFQVSPINSGTLINHLEDLKENNPHYPVQERFHDFQLQNFPNPSNELYVVVER